jgi:hypothetical protein
VTDFKQSAWADYKFAQNYLDKADIYIVERRKMFWFVSSDTLGNQLSALEAAGFADVDCYYKNGIFAAFGGRKK